MSKTKLAVLVFTIAFGLNLAAFLFSKKSFTVEEVKNVWIYELPLTPSPLDAYSASDLGPHQGVIGTLFEPDHLSDPAKPAPFLAAAPPTEEGNAKILIFKLREGLRFQNGDPILPADFLRIRAHLREKDWDPKGDSAWSAWLNADASADGDSLRFDFSKVPGFDRTVSERVVKEVLTHPLSGAVHSKNLEAIRSGGDVRSSWISSGPYKARKWNPKEIQMVSRDDFPIQLPAPFFRTLKYQSAPVKNPASDFILGRSGEKDVLNEHSEQPLHLDLTVFWICRSAAENAFCADEHRRQALDQVLSEVPGGDAGALRGQTIRYRIPEGSESFRAEIRTRIQTKLAAAGAQVEETSYFFKSSKDTDLELLFVVTPAGAGRRELAESLARLSSRFGREGIQGRFVLGEADHFPLEIYMKKMKGAVFPKVFLEPDLDEKKMPF